MDPFEWTPQLSIGVEAIDNDHKYLMSILNMAIAVMNHSEQNDDEIATILEKMLAYTTHHFHREEKVMEVCGYSYIDNHKSIHAMLLKEVKHAANEFAHGRLTANFIVNFLISWLIDHISDADALLTDYCRGKEALIAESLRSMPMQFEMA